MLKRLRKSKNILGQSAVEAMLALPVMLLVYLVGAHMWTLTWNAQYVHVKARLDLHQEAFHKPCTTGGDGGFGSGGNLGGGKTKSVSVTTQDAVFLGGRFDAFKGRTMKAEYHIVCR